MNNWSVKSESIKKQSLLHVVVNFHYNILLHVNGNEYHIFTYISLLNYSVGFFFIQLIVFLAI